MPDRQLFRTAVTLDELPPGKGSIEITGDPDVEGAVRITANIRDDDGVSSSGSLVLEAEAFEAALDAITGRRRRGGRKPREEGSSGSES